MPPNTFRLADTTGRARGHRRPADNRNESADHPAHGNRHTRPTEQRRRRTPVGATGTLIGVNDVTRSCVVCGTEALAEDRFCRNCGTSLQANRPSEPVVRPATERRLVTVLFADLVGSTGRSEGADPEDVADFLTDYFERSHDVITRFGGLVEKYIGDAVMAVWGAQSANEDDAERAVRAGLELQDTIGKLAAEAGDPNIRVRIGILTGEAAVSAGGNETTGMIVGDLVNAASRVQELAEPGTVYVGPTTYRAASNAIAFEPTGKHDVRGRKEPLTTWRAVRVVAERGGRGRVEGIDPPFVGRIAELQLLKDVLGAVVQTGRSRLVSIIGEPGIGKSALIWELRKYADGLATEIFWNRGRSLSYGSEGIVYRAVSDLLRGRLGVAESDPPEAVAAALDATLERFVTDLEDRERIRPWLASVLGLADSPEGDRSEVDAAIRSFVGHMAGVGPTVLVFDDLHWGDAGLLDLAEQLPDWMPNAPVLVIALARPELLERRPGWASGRPGVIALRLGPLPDAFMAELLEGVMGALEPSLKADIIDRAAGVPLYAVELTRALIGDNQTISVDGKTASRIELADFGIPETLQSLIGSRIDRLAKPEQMILQDAAVLGHSFTIDGLTAMTGVDEAALADQLAFLVEQELIEPIRDPRSPLRGSYRFVQKLVRQVARNRMSREMRRTRHLAAAEHFEAGGGPDAAALAADHYLSALELTRQGAEADRLRARASGVLLAALQRGAGLYAHEEVLSLGSRILDLDLDLPTDQQARLMEQMATAASALLNPDAAAHHAEGALELSRRCGDIAGVRRSAALLAFVHLEHLRIEPAVALLNEHLDGIDDLSPDPSLPRLAGLLARAEFLRGNADTALAYADRALITAEELDLKAVIGDALVTKATVLGVTGRPTEAQLLLEAVIDFATRHELNAVALRAYLNLGAVVPPSEMAGNPTLEAIELGRRLGNRNFMLLAKGNLASALVFRAEWDQLEVQLNDPLWQTTTDTTARSRQGIAAIARALHTGTQAPEDELDSVGPNHNESGGWRAFGAESVRALAHLLAGNREAAVEWARKTLEAIETLPWVDGTARLLMLDGDPDDIIRLADAVRSRRQTNDDRLGPFLREAARAYRGDAEAVAAARRHIDALDADGLVVEKVIWSIGLARVLPYGSAERSTLMSQAAQLIAGSQINGLLPFLDRERPDGE